MEMDKLGVVTTFIHNIVVYNIPLLYGTVGEIMVEKSGSLNLGVEGIMAVGAIFGYIVGCYANSLGIGILTAFLMGALCGPVSYTHLDVYKRQGGRPSLARGEKGRCTMPLAVKRRTLHRM